MFDHRAVNRVLLRAIARVEGHVRSKHKIQVRTTGLRVTILLCPVGQVPPGEQTDRQVESCILEAMTDIPAKARTIARKAGYSLSSHFRQALRKLTSEGKITKTDAGWKAVSAGL